MKATDPLQEQNVCSKSADEGHSKDPNLFRGFDMEQLENGIDKTCRVTNEFLFDLRTDTSIEDKVLDPDQSNQEQDNRL